MPTFGHPLGWLALLALPAILAIHFLQRESRRLSSTTLFLLENLAPESTQGRRFDRLRHSVPLWLQLAAALAATWLLVDPQWIRPDTTQHVAIVLDSTVSMLAFRAELLRAIDSDTARLQQTAAHTEWQLLESDLGRPTLYAGSSRDLLLAALRAWQPHLGFHDPGPALVSAQGLLAGRGTLIFATDRAHTVPAGVHLLAVGHPFDHCGFCGLTVAGDHWEALVRNYGVTPQTRTWTLRDDHSTGPAQPLHLAPGTTAVLRGRMPPAARNLTLTLAGSDAFRLDDTLPFLQPELKHLAVSFAPASPLSPFFQQFLASLLRAEPRATQPDLTLATYDPLSPALPKGPSILFVSDPGPLNKLLPGEITAVSHTLAADLNWSGLLVRDSFRVPALPGDRTLVWQGDRPLIFLRSQPAGAMLVINFDLGASNAAQLPAFILLLHRFAEEIRAAKLEPEARNLETNELLTLPAGATIPAPVIAGSGEPAVRAPAAPCFFQVTQGKNLLLRAAAHFADARAADFTQAASLDDVRPEIDRTARRNRQPDPLAALWLLVMCGAMVVSWGWKQT